jgi:hypothetical protein
MKVNGMTTKPMAMEFIFMSTEPSTMVIGKMICKKDMGLKHGQTAASMKDSTAKARKMGKQNNLSIRS